MKLRKPTLVQVFALVLVLIAAAALVLWLEWAFLDDWAPNIATGAIGLAVTITVVEALLGREGRKRLGPRLDRVFYSLGLGLRIFTSAPVWDYTLTHEKTFRRPPRDVSDMLDFWLLQQSTEDTPRDWETDERPSLLDAGIDLARGAKTTADLDREILEPELVAAIDKLAGDIALDARLFAMIDQGIAGDPEDTRRVVREGVVRAVREYVEVLERYADKAWFQLQDLQLDAAESVHRPPPGQQ